MGSNRGGARPRAGRKAGGQNRATIEKAAIAQRIIEETESGKSGRKLGREVLAEFTELFTGLAAAMQPTPQEVASPDALLKYFESPRGKLFKDFSGLAVKTASELAPYQSPKFANVQVAAPPPENTGPRVKKFTFAIFDSQGRPAPKSIDVKATSSTTSAAKN